MTAHLNLDTRRDAIGLAVDLNEAGPIIPLVVFDAPDDLRQAARLSLVSLEARTPHRAAGWSDGAALAEETILEPGGLATLAVSRDWLAERVAILRAHGGPSAVDAVVELPFSTILHLPRAPRASSRRMARIAVSAGASRPTISLQPASLDLDNLPLAEADAVATIIVEVPDDIVFEANRSLVIETTCAGAAADSLALTAPDSAHGEIGIRRVASASPTAARHLVSFDHPDDVAGRSVRLSLMLEREALLAAVDRLPPAAEGQPIALRISAKAMGWGDASAPAAADGPDRRFALAPPAVVSTAGSGDSQSALLAVGEATHAVSFDGDADPVAGPALRFEADPDAAAGAVRFGGLKISVLRWPLGRAGRIEVRMEALIGGETLREPPVQLAPTVERDAGGTQPARSRQGQVVLPLRLTVAKLSENVRTLGALSAGENALSLTVSSNGRPLLRTRMPIALRRSAHRMPVCIDLGASAISIWAGPPRHDDLAFDLKPLPIGSWLSQNVDPAHDEADALDGEAAVLIPSHIGLDSANNLRSDHAPHSLRDAAQIGAGRDAARARMAAFGRRYDVSTPAPPSALRGRAAGRRILGLKHALATGRQTLALAEPVNRYDQASGKAAATTIVEVAPLVADVLDELMDLYVMRLAFDARGGELADPPPVAPRVIVTCPSGIGGEIEARYGAALALFAKRLDRLFPGASAFGDAAIALPEAVAAARYAAEMLAPAIKAAPGEPIFLAALDFGASTSDVAVARISTQAGRLQTFEPVSTFGLPAGGDAIDRAIVRIVAPLVDRLTAGPQAAWTRAFDAPDLGRALASDEISCIGAQQWFWAALRRGKAALTDAVLAEAGAGPYRWRPDGAATLDIALAESAGDGVWRGLCRPTQAPQDDVKLAEHAHAVVETATTGSSRLVLRLGRPALEDGSDAARALARTVEALGVHLQRMARAAAPSGKTRPKVIIAPTGRAALWPPLFEALAGEAAHGRDVFPLARPLAPGAMKKAVVAGAALLAAQMRGPPARGDLACPLAIAVSGAHLAEALDGTLSMGAVAARILYLSFDAAGTDRTFAAEEADAASLAARADLGQRFQFVRAAPGLDPQGRTLGALRVVLGHHDPVAPLEGDFLVDAKAERIDRFGICEVESRAVGTLGRRVTITARDRDWTGVWDIEGDRVVRMR